MSITMLGFDPDHERIEPADIARIRRQFPESRLIMYAGDIPEQCINQFHDMGVFAYISKQASIDELTKCLEAALYPGELSQAPNGDSNVNQRRTLNQTFIS